jgi:hypothetical protein
MAVVDRRQPDGPRVLTVKQPWAGMIIHGGRDVENRSWRTRYTGLLLIYAAVDPDPAGMEFAETSGITVPLEYRVIVGSVQLTGCVRDSASRWAAPGSWHWLLEQPQPARPGWTVPGNHGHMFRAPAGWEQAFER